MKNNKLNQKIWQNDMPDFNDDLMWSRIEIKLDENRSKPVFFYWLFVTIIIVLGVSTYILNKYIGNEKHAINNQFVLENKNKVSDDIRQVVVNSSHNNTKELKKVKLFSNTNDDKTISKIKLFSAIKSDKRQIYKNERLSYVIKSNKNIKDFKDMDESKQIEKNSRTVNELPYISNYLSFISHIETNLQNIRIVPNHILSKANIKNINNSFFITSLTGIGASISNTGYNSKSQWQNRKFINEKTLYNYMFSTQIAKPVYKNLFVSIGLQYHNTISNYKEESKEVFTEFFQSDSAFVIRNTDVFLPGKRTKTTTIERKMSYYNKLIHWSIPTTIGYTWNKNKNGFVVSGGLLFRINSSLLGYTLSPDNTIDKYENFKMQIKKHLGLSQMNISVYYARSIFQHIDVLFGFNTIYSIQPDYSINQSYFIKNYSINIGTGFNYKF